MWNLAKNKRYAEQSPQKEIGSWNVVELLIFLIINPDFPMLVAAFEIHSPSWRSYEGESHVVLRMTKVDYYEQWN